MNTLINSLKILHKNTLYMTLLTGTISISSLYASTFTNSTQLSQFNLEKIKTYEVAQIGETTYKGTRGYVL